MSPVDITDRLTFLGRREDSVMSTLYLYSPSLAAACIFIALFTLSAVAHLALIFKHRTKYFVPFLFGIACEIVGYVGRAVSASQTPNWTVFPYALQSLMLLIAPSLLAASIYGMLGRIIAVAKGEHYSLVHPRKLTKIFVTSDVLSFLVQSGGGGILSNAKSQTTIQMGENIIIAGLFIQLVGFTIFMAVTIIFHKRILRDPKSNSINVAVPWWRFLWVLYGVSFLVLVRSLFRVIEYIQGYDGYLQTTEVFLYVFDGALMFIVTFVLAVIYPSFGDSKADAVYVQHVGSPELHGLVSVNVHTTQDLDLPSPPKYTNARPERGH